MDRHKLTIESLGTCLDARRHRSASAAIIPLALFCLQPLAMAQFPSFHGSGAKPGSPVNSVQYNNAGKFGGVSGLTQDPTTGGLFWTQVVDPANAPTAALAGLGAGNLSNGVYKYDVAFVTAQGITLTSQVSGPSSVTVVDHTVNGQVALTNIPTSPDPRVTKRRLLRTLVNGTPCIGCAAFSNGLYILAYLNDNTTTTFTDNVSDATLQSGTYGTFAVNVPAESWFTNINRSAGALISGDTNFGSATCIELMFTGIDMFVPNNNDFTGLGCGALIYYGVEADPLGRDVNGAVQVLNPGGFGNLAQAHGGAISANTFFQESDNTGGNGNLAKYDANGKVTDGPSSTTPSFIKTTLTGSAFAGLGAPANGTEQYCSDCQVTSGADNTCTNGGTGAMAFRINGAWKCLQ